MSELTRYDSSPFAKDVGIELLEATADRAVAALNVTENHCNTHGTMHGGAIFTLADHAFGEAERAGGQDFVAMQMHIRYLRPAKPGQRLTAVAQRLHQGRSTAFYQIEVRDEANRLIAHLTGTGHAPSAKKEK
jgi:acyl-CoA thioesterase